jgi:hypothetical protein
LRKAVVEPDGLGTPGAVWRIAVLVENGCSRIFSLRIDEVRRSHRADLNVWIWIAIAIALIGGAVEERGAMVGGSRYLNGVTLTGIDILTQPVGDQHVPAAARRQRKAR